MAVTAAAADSTIAFYLHLQSYSRRCTSSGSTASSSVSRSMVESSGSRLSSLQSPSTRRGSGFWGDGLGFVGTAMERAAVGTTKTKTTTKTMTKTGGESKKGERSRRESEMKQTEKKRWRFSAPPSTTTETAASKSPPSTTTTLESHFPSPLSSAPASSSSEKTSSLPWPSASPLEPKPAKMRFLKCITHTFSSTKNTTPAPAPFPSPPSPLPHIHSSFSSFSPSASASSLSPSTFSSSFSTHTHTHTHPSSRSRSPSTSSSSSSTGTSIIYTPISFRLPFFRRTPTEPQQEYKLVPLPVRPGVLRDRWFLRAVMVPVGSRRSRKGGGRWDGEMRGEGRRGWGGRDGEDVWDEDQYEGEERYDRMGEKYGKNRIVVMPEMQHLSGPYQASGSDTSRVSILGRTSVGNTCSHESKDSGQNPLSDEEAENTHSSYSSAPISARDRVTPPTPPRLASRNPYRRFEPTSTPTTIHERPIPIALEREIPIRYRRQRQRQRSPHHQAHHQQHHPHPSPLDTPSLHQLLCHLSRLSYLSLPPPSSTASPSPETLHHLLHAHLPNATLIPPVCRTLLHLRSHQESEFLEIRERWIRVLERWLDEVKGFHEEEELEGAFLGAVVVEEKEVVVQKRGVWDTLEEGKVEGRVGRRKTVGGQVRTGWRRKEWWE